MTVTRRSMAVAAKLAPAKVVVPAKVITTPEVVAVTAMRDSSQPGDGARGVDLAGRARCRVRGAGHRAHHLKRIAALRAGIFVDWHVSFAPCQPGQFAIALD